MDVSDAESEGSLTPATFSGSSLLFWASSLGFSLSTAPSFSFLGRSSYFFYLLGFITIGFIVFGIIIFEASSISSRAWTGSPPDATMGWSDEAGGKGAFNDIPSWDSQPGTWNDYVSVCKWYVSGLQRKDRNVAAARLLRRLTGAAKRFVMHLDARDFEREDGVDRFLRVLAESPLRSPTCRRGSRCTSRAPSASWA